MCDNILCFLFGPGPGSHSFYSGAVLGENALLGFDQLQGRVILEWGVLGAMLWSFLFLYLIFTNNKKISIPISIYVLFGFLIGFGSEFIFENYSGQIYGFFLGGIYGLYRKSNSNDNLKILNYENS